jgi:DNA-binding response OmpR family regulator
VLSVAVVEEPGVSSLVVSSCLAEQARWHVSAIEQVDRALAGGPAVAILCWPEEQSVIEQLAQQQVPRLLLVGQHAEPAPSIDDLEDWVRLPAADCDVKARIRSLRRRAIALPPRPLLDGSGRLIYEGRWVELAPVEERLAVPLVASFGRVISDRRLIAAGWPDGPPADGTLRPRVSRLRRRVATLGLDVMAVRAQGYCLQRVETAALP